METIKTNKLLTALVLLLMAMNITLAIALWHGRPQGPTPPGAPPPDNLAFLTQELSLSGKQVEQVRLLRQQHFSALRLTLDSIRQIKDRVLQGTEDGTLQNGELDSLLERLIPLQAAIERKTFEHFTAMRQLLTAEQQGKLKGLLRELLPPPGVRPPGTGAPPHGPDAAMPPPPQGGN